jgi:methionyl-tRNA formyltransferase
MLNIAFFGSSVYSVTILKKLLSIKDFKVSAVITKADKAVGRHQTITPNPVSAFAKKNNLQLLQPSEFDQQFIKKYRQIKADLALVVAYGPPYFTQEMIDIPKYKVVNIHPSPLPKYRGATPGPWQIINGETKSALTFFQIDPLPDHGPIIKQVPFNIDPNETATTFYNKAFDLAVEKLESVLKDYVQNPTKIQIQDHFQKNYFPKFNKDKAQIDWSWDQNKILRFINALNPWPVAWTYITNQANKTFKMKIFTATLENKQLLPKSVQIEAKNKSDWSQISGYYSIKKST